jgi:hypothetical protein
MANIEFVKCQRCGAVFPGDYQDQWGRKYGRGLGREPKCEALSSKYHRPIARPKSGFLPMHPLGVCRGLVLPVMLPADTETMIPAATDPGMVRRAPIMREIQRKKSNALAAQLAMYERKAGK